MKKAAIYVFSGTGHTKIAADMIAAQLSALGLNTTVYRVKAPFDDAPDPRAFDVAGFGFPVHAFNTPRFFLRFVKTCRTPLTACLHLYSKLQESRSG